MSRARDFADLAGSADAGGLTGRNLIINGAMQVAQRGTTTSVTSGYGGCDRWKLIRAGASAFTLSKDSDAPTGSGFTSSWKIDVTTADSSLAASDSVQIMQLIEAQNLQRIKKGTSSAESLTLSFWIKSSVTGTYIVEWYAEDSNRHINKSYTISSANTWEFKTITISGDTTGVIANDNGPGIQLSWWLMAGSDYTSGTLQTSWGTLDQTGRAVGQVNAVNDAANNIYLTGVQLEVGQAATDFEHEDYATTLARCQRYYYESGGTATNDWGQKGYLAASAYCANTLSHPVAMRGAPDVVKAGTFVVSGIAQPAALGSSPVTWQWQAQKTSSAGTYTMYSNSSGKFTLSSEL